MSLDLAHYNDYWKIIRDLNKKFETNINDNMEVLTQDTAQEYRRIGLINYIYI